MTRKISSEISAVVEIQNRERQK